MSLSLALFLGSKSWLFLVSAAAWRSSCWFVFCSSWRSLFFALGEVVLPWLLRFAAISCLMLVAVLGSFSLVPLWFFRCSRWCIWSNLAGVLVAWLLCLLLIGVAVVVLCCLGYIWRSLQLLFI
ncbi:hypothetical protein U1Q18_007408 [Sarracenia purpurea var. burkii]